MLQVFQYIVKTLRRERTLKEGFTIGKTFQLTILILITLSILGEVVARQKFFQSIFLAPGIGSSHRQLEIQLGRIKRIKEEGGKIDCIIIGSSVVQEGFNPVYFRAAYKSIAGKNISCYNFGVDGLTPIGAHLLTLILLNEYTPWIIIYGTDPRDYAYPWDVWENTSIINSPWIQYKLGELNVVGWLYDHSLLLQYQKSVRRILHLKLTQELRRYRDWQEAEHYGYNEVQRIRVPVSKPPDQNTNTSYVRIYSQLFSNFQVYPENLKGLEQFLTKQNNEIKIFVVEMPFAPGYIDFLPNGYDDYNLYIKKISEIINSNHVSFLRPMSEVSFPITNWNDYNHLNVDGSRLFSEWLGMEIAEILQNT